MSKIRMFEYARGEEYKVHVTVATDSSMTFVNLKLPAGTSEEIAEQFLEEAEIHVNKVLEKEFDKAYSGS